MTPQAAVAPGGRRVRLTWPDGRTQELAAPWLFDHADEARDPVTGQRGHGPLDARDAVEAVAIQEGWLTLRFAPSGVERRIRLESLAGAAIQRGPLELWGEPGAIAAEPPLAFDDYLHDDHVLREALSRVVRMGLAVLHGAGEAPGAVQRAVARFGHVRETNYGRVFDVRIAPRPENLAYSDRGLDLHTDNPYRDPAPTLQLLHGLVGEPVGGQTLFVDGFAQAEALRAASPDAFTRLALVPVRFTYRSPAGACWSARKPILSLDETGAVDAVRLNHRSLDLEPGEAAETEAWYAAYLDFYRRAHAPGAAFAVQIGPGVLVIFDNRRILHGRSALAAASPRWQQGCYADIDGLEATLARLERAGPIP